MFANQSASQQPDRNLSDPLLKIFSLGELEQLESKPLHIQPALEQLRACCQLDMIPEDARQSTAQITVDLLRRDLPRVNCFLECVATLAHWEGTKPNERWIGLNNLAQLKDISSLYREVLTTVLDACKEAERPEIVGFAFRGLNTVRGHQWAGAYLHLMEQSKEIRDFYRTSASADLAREISLLAVSRALAHDTMLSRLFAMLSGTNTLDSFKQALASTHPSPDGHRARIGIFGLDASFNPTSIAASLVVISKAEKQIHDLAKHGLDLSILYNIEYRDIFVATLDRAANAAEKIRIGQMIVDAQHSKSALDALKSGLSHNFKHEARTAYLDQIDTYRSGGLRLSSSILLATHFGDTVRKIGEIFDSTYDSRDRFYELIPAIDNFLDRGRTRLNQGRMACFQEIINRLSASQILEFPESFRKIVLILSGKGLKPSDSINTMEQLSLAITELSAKAELSIVMNGFHGDKADFARRFKIDNPPFSLEREPLEKQVQFQREVNSIMRRAPDGHYGFWANTYFFKHTPIGGRCAHDEMAMALNADLYAIPCKDVSRFPGRGRIVENIDPERVFTEQFSSDYWREVVFPHLGPVHGATGKGNIHAIDNVLRLRVTSLRGQDAFEIKGNSFTHIAGEPMTLVTPNHHGDASTPYEVALVPSHAYNSFFTRLKIPYNPFSDPYPGAEFGDISDEPPTLDAIHRRSLEMGLGVGVLNITSGSCFSGGLCNGAIPKSPHFHKWEQRDASKANYYDAFEHLHKWHIQHDPVTEKSLRDLHRRAYEVATALFNARDIYKHIVGFYARGHVQKHGHNPHDERLSAYPVKIGAQYLQLFSEFTEECHLKGIREQAPVLILAPMNKWAALPDSPIVLDGRRRYAFQLWGKPFEFDVNDGIASDNLIEWWQTHVDTALEDSEYLWYAPRLVAADNYEDLMKEYGGMYGGNRD